MNADNLVTATSNNDEQNNNCKLSILESGQEDTYMSEPDLTMVNWLAENEWEVTKPEMKKPSYTKQYINLPEQATLKQINMRKWLYDGFSFTLLTNLDQF